MTTEQKVYKIGASRSQSQRQPNRESNVKQVTITVESREQVEAILAALQEAEELGEIEFVFNVQVEEV